MFKLILCVVLASIFASVLTYDLTTDDTNIAVVDICGITGSSKVTAIYSSNFVKVYKYNKGPYTCITQSQDYLGGSKVIQGVFHNGSPVFLSEIPTLSREEFIAVIKQAKAASSAISSTGHLVQSQNPRREVNIDLSKIPSAYATTE
jgi:hypothetical protein